MGQAKRRRQQLGDLYGTPEGSNRPLVVYQGFDQDELDKKAIASIANALRRGQTIRPSLCLTTKTVADMVLDPNMIIGIRPHGRTRVLVVDINAHQPAPSPYWHPDGPGASPAVQRLLHEAEKAGCRCVIYRTPSGGWHVWIVLPEAKPVAIAHCMGRTLVAAAGMELGSGRCELTPSPAKLDEEPDAWLRGDQRGIRLPGQTGGALWTGSGWEADPELAWRELAAAVDALTPTTGDPADAQ